MGVALAVMVGTMERLLVDLDFIQGDSELRDAASAARGPEPTASSMNVTGCASRTLVDCISEPIRTFHHPARSINTNI